MAGRIRVGMSGFSYPSWVGTLYPPGTKPADMLARYAERFDVVEINTTFRRLPEPSTVQRWRDTVGEDFRFAVKAPQRITHMRRLLAVEPELAEFIERMRILGPRLGPLLFQTPPTLAFEQGRMAEFCAALPGDIACAIEPRDPSFDDPAFEAMLGANRVAWCRNDEVFDPETYPVTAPVAYLRLRREDYGPGELRTRADLVRRIAEQEVGVYVFFKHEDRPDAPDPALRFADLIEGGVTGWSA